MASSAPTRAFISVFSSRAGMFGVTSALQGLCSFCLLPILARGFNHADLSQWALCEPLFVLLPGLLTLGGHHQLLRCRPEAIAAGHVTPTKLLTGGLWSAVLIAALLIAPLVLLVGFANAVLFSMNLLLDAVALIEQFRNRALIDGVGYAKVTAGKVLAFLLIALVWLMLYGAFDLRQVLIARCFATFAVLFLSNLAWSRNHIIELPPNPRFRVGIRFGLPIAMAAAALVAGDAIERAVLLASVSASEVTQYYIHARLVAFISLMLLTPVALAFPAIRRSLLDRSTDAQHRQLLALQTIVIGAGTLMTVSLAALSSQIIPLIAPGTEVDRLLVILVGFGCLFKGMGTIFGIGLFSSTGSRVVLIAATVCIAVGVTIGWILLPALGTRGMGIGSAISGSLYLLWICFSSRKAKKIGIPFAKLALLLGVAAFAVGCAVIGKWQ